MKIAKTLFATLALAGSFEASCTADGSCVSEETALLQGALSMRSASSSLEASMATTNRSTYPFTNNDIIRINGHEVASGETLDALADSCQEISPNIARAAGSHRFQFTVCGGGVKVLASLMGQCRAYGKYTRDVGRCDGNPECVTVDFDYWQPRSYEVIRCPVGVDRSSYGGGSYDGDAGNEVDTRGDTGPPASASASGTGGEVGIGGGGDTGPPASSASSTNSNSGVPSGPDASGVLFQACVQACDVCHALHNQQCTARCVHGPYSYCDSQCDDGRLAGCRVSWAASPGTANANGLDRKYCNGFLDYDGCPRHEN